MTCPTLTDKRAWLLKRTGEEQRKSGERVVHTLMDTLYREVKAEIEARAEVELEPKVSSDGKTLETVGSDRTSYVRGMQDALDVMRQACRLVKGHEQL